MYISELALQGFKSFAYKTQIKFDRGITAIVGPNGCGKSNIVDSMRWVLGEQRPTLLRSSTMANVIFNGTAQKNALGLAEVALTFVNNKGLLPTEYSEVTITRRLYRSGESEYLINDTTCRLKDVMALFMDTGMSSDAYSVIELKMVEEILNNTNQDRRRLFEEAAGITGYKKKRTKTLRKLESTQKDLQRVEDIVSEIRKQTYSLERQSKKARQAKEYTEELHILDQAFNRYKYNSIQGELDPLKKRINNADKEKKKLLKKTNELEHDESEIREALNEKERRQSDAQRRVDQVVSALRDHETTLQITLEKISTEQNIIKQYEKDIKQGEKDIRELRELLVHSRKQLDKWHNELEEAERSLKDSNQKYAAVQKEYSGLNAELSGLRESFTQKSEDLNVLKSEAIKARAKLENTTEDVDRIHEEKVQLKGEIDGLEKDKKAIFAALKKVQKKVAKNEEKLTNARQKREQLSNERNELKDKLRSSHSKRESVRAEIEMLQHIASSNEAFPSSVKYLLENHAGEFGTMETVSHIFSSDEKYAVALEAVLGDALNFVVVESLDDARNAAQLLKDHKKGKATFVPLKQLAGSYKVHKNSLGQYVKTNKKYAVLKQLLLGEVLLAESLKEAEKTLKDGLSVVTREGEVFTGHHFLLSGSEGKNAGMRVGLQNKIEKLEKKVSKLNTQIDKDESRLNKTTAAYEKIEPDKLEAVLAESQKEMRLHESRLNNIESKIQIYQQNTASHEERVEELTEMRISVTDNLENLQPQQEKLEKLLHSLNEKRQSKKESVIKLEEERSIAQSRYNEVRLEHQDLKNKVANIEHDIERTETGIKNLETRLEKRVESKEISKVQIEDYKKAVKTLEEKVTIDKENKEEAEKNLEEAKEHSAARRGDINRVEKELKEVRRQKEVNMELVHHLSMAKEKFEMQAQNIADHVWETYEILMNQIKAELPEDIDPDEAKERISWLRQKLNKIGEVNELAIDEYKDKKERLDFYEKQIQDLEDARKELQESIAEINKTAEERFNVTFERIRINFQQVFHTLFNEDDFCDLAVDSNTEDPLEARIEIEANPRGKRPTGINQLSGGEKTLTAIALLFAIYLVKPSPFCVLDEVDAPLDDANIERFAHMIQRFSKDTQFIIITHNKMTMAKAEMMYGVTMPETGISRLVGVKMDELAETG